MVQERVLVLLLDDYRQTITVVRSLGQAGHDVIVGKETPRAYSEFSRYAKGAWCHPPVGSAEFVPALEAFLADKDPKRTYVFPIGEASLIAVTEGLPRLLGKAHFVLPPPPSTRRCLDKAGSYRLSAALGVPLPRTAELSSCSTRDWHVALDAVGIPCVIKRNDSTHELLGKKAVICYRLDDFIRFQQEYERATEAGAEALSSDENLLLQEWVPGYRHNCHFAAYDGKLIAYFEQRVLRTDQIDGTGYGVEGESVEPSPELRRYTAKFASELGYTGVGCAQFLLDESTGRAHFLELNPRLDATTAIAYLCGYDFPKLAIECARAAAEGRGPPEPLTAAYPTRRPLHWFHRDLWACVHALRHGEITSTQGIAWFMSFLSAAIRIRNHTTFRWSDPLPTSYLYTSLIWSFVETQFGRRAEA